MDKSLSRAQARQKISPTQSEKLAPDTRSASEKIWNFSWDAHLPFVSEEHGVSVDVISLMEFRVFAAQHFKQAFDFSVENEFTQSKSSEARDRYLLEQADCFGLFGNGELIGVAVGTVTDWTAYHIRNITIADAHQGKGLGRLMLQKIGELIASYGAQKLELYVAPANYKSMGMLLKLGAVPLAQENSDQWGAIIKMIVFLDLSAGESFLSKVSAYSQSAHRVALGRK